ncbi:MAG: hypothetical protein ACE5EY_07640, partial [Anaerolineae bacterium]
MIQSQIQTSDYWGRDFALSDADVEQIYNHFLEVERPQTAAEIAQVIIASRVAEAQAAIERQLAGRTIYQPRKNYAVGDDLVFPKFKFAHSKVTAVRQGYNPQDGKFNVISVKFNNKAREFAAGLAGDHMLNHETTNEALGLEEMNVETLYAQFGGIVEEKLAAALGKREEFVRLNREWFVKPLMAEMNVGHLHLAEAVLEVSEGGPLKTAEILQHLDMDDSLDPSVLDFSLNYGLLNDGRFDEVAPAGKVAWFLKRLEPKAVQGVPDRLSFSSIPYDRALLSPQLLQLERELDDEWSDLPVAETAGPIQFTLLYSHRVSGT